MDKLRLKGPDISVHNGDIDFEIIKKNFDFCILRCGYGSDYTNQDDENFVNNALECERLDIPYGVYLYSYADTVDKALSEAKHTLRLIKDRKISFGVWYDLEDKILPKNKELLSAIAVTFLEEIEKAGYYAGIYSYLNFFKDRFNSEKIKAYDKWLAYWNEKDEFKENHGMWQYTSNEKIENHKGVFDMNIAYLNYKEITENMKKEKITPFKVKIKVNGVLNVRNGAGTNYNIKKTLKSGEIVKIVSLNNGWGEIESGGFISMNYTEKFEDEPSLYKVTAESGLNIRPSPSTEKEALGKLEFGKEIKVNKIEDGWAEIDLNIKAYLHSDYLTKI